MEIKEIPYPEAVTSIMEAHSPETETTSQPPNVKTEDRFEYKFEDLTNELKATDLHPLFYFSCQDG